MARARRAARAPARSLLGAIVALAVPRLTAPLRPLRVRVRRPVVVARFILTVARDVLRSNFEVAWGVLAVAATGRRAARS